MPDRVHHSVEIVLNVIIEEAEHAKTTFGQPFCAPRVVLGLLCVGIAIKFDHEPPFETAKIRNEAVERVLAAKSRAANVLAA